MLDGEGQMSKSTEEKRIRQVDLLERITANPHILGGKPVIRGTRISVEFILELLASGATESDILEDYPHLKPSDIKVCLRKGGDEK